MTRAIPVSPFMLLARSAALFLASLSSVRRETEADPALVRENAAYYFKRFGNAVLRLAYSYLHNTADSEDVLQETMMQYIRCAPRFENDRHAKAWLMRVAANLSQNRIGSNKIRAADELDETLAAEAREDLSFVWQAVKGLPVHQREAIHLFYQEGYSTAEIAGILGRNESTVRSDLKRGREALRAVLKEAYDFE